MQMQALEYEEKVAPHIMAKETVFRMPKELLHINEKSVKSNRKWAKKTSTRNSQIGKPHDR